NSGIYCFCGRRLSENIDKIDNNNVQGEYYLTDMVGIYRQIGEPVSALLAEDDSELLGVNSRVQLAQVTKIMQRRINESLMAAGVTMLDPSMVWVGPEVTVGQDTELLPMTMLWGKTSVGNDCVIGPNTRLTDVTVGDGSSVEETVGYQTVIDEDVTVGPRAYLRPGTHLCDRAHVGTHVEIKNSTIGEGSKVPHLSYIGDTTMGSGVNIGAGSITCNYDGVNKHRTTIGDGVFIGSDTMMVAPVSIGDGALVGASSCITTDVPADALSLERSEQRIVEGYAKMRREALQRRKDR
ncbi:MAG: DapH/DapD/GlmU-related protein, partial [Coriobacteriales bacterium]|nr:DapH/DapD/GlmU-related protein [Coriobacteriales bacterium]